MWLDLINNSSEPLTVEQVASIAGESVEYTKIALTALVMGGKIACEGDLFLSKSLLMARLSVA